MIVLEIIGIFVVCTLLGLGLQWVSTNVSFNKKES